jgi:catechol 2,3-dioxygenase-like lactoylglutathione lyase family enzyme
VCCEAAVGGTVASSALNLTGPIMGAGITPEGGAMAVQLNHTIVSVRDKEASANFLADILGLDPPTPFGPFLCLETANGVSLDYDDRGAPEHHHYAFLVTEEEFDAIFTRVTARGLTYWADPGHRRANCINNHGRGFYFEDPSGHNMEVLTRPYGT